MRGVSKRIIPSWSRLISSLLFGSLLAGLSIAVFIGVADEIAYPGTVLHGGMNNTPVLNVFYFITVVTAILTVSISVLMLLLGLPMHFVFRRKNIQEYWPYAVCGAVLLSAAMFVNGICSNVWREGEGAPPISSSWLEQLASYSVFAIAGAICMMTIRYFVGAPEAEAA